ncbi:hypothetical protein [Bacillus halotolerans]|uniref:hypothetical protein n=1 Tax=Bacillus halotolerans TaxID=260554 RepID=UPI0020C25F74|nr:hypothetical protein [Bacillus halotolerans]UTL75120.1 hypothetical protein NLW79_12905 [Bacillus halotolerans]WPC79016.1 hypothetical protein RA179_12030 [Bacillus halotolerans]
MAKSRAKRKREHLLRNSGRDALLSRGSSPSFSTHERMVKRKHKHKNPYDHNAFDDRDFFMPETAA